MSNQKHCTDCRDGEHPNYDDEVVLARIVDPDSGNRFVKRGYLCREHRQTYEADGYRVTTGSRA